MLEVHCLDKDNNIIEHLTQWDVDQYILIKNTGLSKAPAIHFCNTSSKEALVVSSTIESGAVKAKIPNILLQDKLLVVAYLYVCDPSVSDKSAKTMAEIRIPIRPRPKPSTYPYVGDVDYITPSGISKSVAALLEAKVDKVDGMSLSANDYTDVDKTDVGKIKDKADKKEVYTRTEIDNKLDGRVSKENGKGLSANDFTDVYKEKLDNLDSNISETVAGKADKTDVLTKDNTEAFTPASDYQPATKKYVDDSVSSVSFPVIDNLSDTSETSALSAKQGKILNDTKVDKQEGKGLSANDFTDEYKAKIDALNADISETVAAKADKDSVLTKTNTDEYSPTSSYHPATKKYVDDLVSSAAGSGGGDMLRGIYDTDKSGVVDDSEKLGGRTPNYYIGVDDYVILDAGSATEVI